MRMSIKMQSIEAEFLIRNMKLLVVLLVVVAGALAANIQGSNSSNGLRATLEKQGVLRSRLYRQPNVGTKIVGGNNGDINEIPYVVALHEIGWGQICGAVTVSATRCLTAAHCTEWFPEYPLEVQAGSNSLNSDGQRVRVANAVDHPNYDDQSLNHDISVLQLASPLNLGQPGIAAIPLPAHGSSPAVGTSARVSGWGALYEGHGGSTYLQYTRLPIISNAHCNQLYPNFVIIDGKICTYLAGGGQDACQGDSGGPLSAANTLVGIDSWGIGCARAGHPGVYARVAYYRPWIDTLL